LLRAALSPAPCGGTRAPRTGFYRRGARTARISIQRWIDRSPLTSDVPGSGACAAAHARRTASGRRAVVWCLPSWADLESRALPPRKSSQRFLSPKPSDGRALMSPSTAPTLLGSCARPAATAFDAQRRTDGLGALAAGRRLARPTEPLRGSSRPAGQPLTAMHAPARQGPLPFRLELYSYDALREPPSATPPNKATTTPARGRPAPGPAPQAPGRVPLDVSLRTVPDRLIFANGITASSGRRAASSNTVAAGELDRSPGRSVRYQSSAAETPRAFPSRDLTNDRERWQNESGRRETR